MQDFGIIFRLVLVSGLLFPSLTQAQSSPVADSTKIVTADTLVVKDTIPRNSSKQVDDIISFAKKFLGTPYRYAGSTPSGFDCSGFISYVMGNFGIGLARTSYGMAEFGRTVKLSDVQPGDLLFFKGSNVRSTQVGHVGMVVEVSPGVIKFIHSANSGVTIDNMMNSKYYVPRFIKAKRLDFGIEE